MLRYLPPGTHLGSLEKSGWIRSMVLLRPSSRPLIGLDEGQRIERSLKGKQVKLNRLKKLGTVSFRRVENAEFSEVLEHAWPLYEFRQIGQYNSTLFRSDADLKRFFVAMTKHSDAVHMTVLKVDEAIIAWLLGIQGDGYFHLTATGFSPFHARHSPATLHMLMLAKSLIQERSVFDLTPGGDKYKDQLATCYEETHTLYFFPNFRAAIEYKQTRVLAGKAVKKVVRIALKNPARSMAASFFGGKRDTPFVGNQHPRELGVRFRLHKFDAAYFGRLDERVDAVRKNSVADLIRYESTQAQSLRDFVREARGFIDQGADAYTLVRGGLLVASCWIMTGERAPSAGLANYGVPAGTALLVGFYVHASEDPAKMLSICMEKWRGEIAPVKKATEIIIGIPETDVFRDILVSGEETPEGLLSGNQVIAVGCQDMVGK
ncbi:MAG TPA: GNAT family N-acetyltransferase [Bryobacteraceae bacterium]